MTELNHRRNRLAETNNHFESYAFGNEDMKWVKSLVDRIDELESDVEHLKAELKYAKSRNDDLRRKMGTR